MRLFRKISLLQNARFAAPKNPNYRRILTIGNVNLICTPTSSQNFTSLGFPHLLTRILLYSWCSSSSIAIRVAIIATWGEENMKFPAFGLIWEKRKNASQNRRLVIDVHFALNANDAVRNERKFWVLRILYIFVYYRSLSSNAEWSALMLFSVAQKKVANDKQCNGWNVYIWSLSVFVNWTFLVRYITDF